MEDCIKIEEIKMKEFKDLEFEEHSVSNSARSRMSFNNGYGVSVVKGAGSYSSDVAPYEVAVLYDNNLCYNTYITNDVIGWCTEEKVTEIMKQVQELTQQNS